MPKYLKDTRDGRIWVWTEVLAKKEHLVPLTEEETLRFDRLTGNSGNIPVDRYEAIKPTEDAPEPKKVVPGWYTEKDMKELKMFQLYSICKDFGIPFGKGHKKDALIAAVLERQAQREE